MWACSSAARVGALVGAHMPPQNASAPRPTHESMPSPVTTASGIRSAASQRAQHALVEVDEAPVAPAVDDGVAVRDDARRGLDGLAVAHDVAVHPGRVRQVLEDLLDRED